MPNQSRLAVRVATRASPLARWQAGRVAQMLEALPGAAPCELVEVSTSGDRVASAPLSSIGGEGVFVKEVEQAVLDGRADIAVHSAKDLPSQGDPRLALACVPERADPRDALVGSTLEGIRTGGLVLTGSPRRRAQLAWLRPDLTFGELRGNIATRLEHAGESRVVVVAAAALDRLDLRHRAAEVLSCELMLPQVGQGALAVECAAGNAVLRSALEAIDDWRAHKALKAERGFLAAVGGGCALPVAGHAQVGEDGAVLIEGMIASSDGHVMVRARLEGDDPDVLGAALARELLDGRGGSALLARSHPRGSLH